MNIPGGIRHGPVTWKKQLALVLVNESPVDDRRRWRVDFESRSGKPWQAAKKVMLNVLGRRRGKPWRNENLLRGLPRRHGATETVDESDECFPFFPKSPVFLGIL